MEITDVKVIPVDDDKLKAFVSIVFDHCFVVTDIKVINGPKGLFVSMPSKKRKDGTFKDIAHPLNNQTRQYLEEKVLGVYRQQVASADAAPAPATPAPAAPEPAPAPEAAASAPPVAQPVADSPAPAEPSPAVPSTEEPEATGKEGSQG